MCHWLKQIVILYLSWLFYHKKYILSFYELICAKEPTLLQIVELCLFLSAIWYKLVGYVILVAITGTIILVPYL